MTGLRQDIAFALRMLVKDRRFTLAAVIALGLAIGLNNSVFTLVNTALIRDLPFDRADRLVSITIQAQRGPSGVSYPDFLDWQRHSTSFEGLAATMNTVMNLSEADRPPDRYRGTYVSASTFGVLRVKPLIGRDFLPEDDRPGAPGVVIIGHRVWQDRYAGDPTVVGRAVRINDVPATIVGVMPEGFRFPFVNHLWQPLSQAPALAKPRRDARNLDVIARLEDDADLGRARADLETVAAQLAREFPDTNTNVRPTVIPMRETTRFGVNMLWIFMGAVALVLLIACANLANLLLARATSRAREVAIRSSLGATRWRIIRQLLVECAFIAGLAAVLGIALSIVGARTIAVGFDIIEPGAPAGTTTPYWVDLSLDKWIVAFVSVLAAFATFACGLLPAWQVSRTDANDVLKDGSRTGGSVRARWWTTAFVVSQVALTLMLLSATGLLWRQFLERYNVDPIVDTTNMLTMSVGLPVQKYSTPELRQRFFDQLDERLQRLPGVTSATIANAPPLEFIAIPSRELIREGDTIAPDQLLPSVSLLQTGARYFETVKLPVVRGRAFNPADGTPGHETAVVDERVARTFFADADPIGQRIRLRATRPKPSDSAWLTIVGIVPRLPYFGPPDLDRPVVYVAMPAIPLQGPAAIVVRAQAGQQIPAVIAALREQVRAIDPALPLYAIETMDAMLVRSRMAVRLIGTWFAIIAGIALLLAAVGLYALTAHGVVQRTQEVGIRMALGARSSEVLWLFLRRAALQLGVGVALGLAGTVAAARVIRALVNTTDANPYDPITLTTVVLFLVAVALLSSMVPARRATRVDPMVALRRE